MRIKLNLSVDFHKFRYYSAHDSTLNALLCAFDVMDDSSQSWPTFAAHIEVELWKKQQNGSYYVRVYYCDQLLELPSCTNGQACQLDEFIQILNKHSVDDHSYNHLCSQDFTG